MRKSRSHIVITGGAGFIGSNIAAALSGAGHDVAICDWMGKDDRWRNLAKHELSSLISPEGLSEYLKNTKEIDAIIHMGAISSTTETDVDLIANYNIRLPIYLWKWCAEHDCRLIYASSAATYGDGSDGFDDDTSKLHVLRPLNAYGWSKHVFDRWAIRHQSEAPRQWVGLKFFNVYGPNEYHKGEMQSIIAKNFSRIRDGGAMKLFRSYRPDYVDGGQLRDFVYVRDCVDVIEWLLNNPEICGIFNLGSGIARSWLDLAHTLFAAAHREPKIEFVDMPVDIRERYQYRTQARMNKLRDAGYTGTSTQLEDGVCDYVSKYLATSDPYR